jgi:hypothetical protein
MRRVKCNAREVPRVELESFIGGPEPQADRSGDGVQAMGPLRRHTRAMWKNYGTSFGSGRSLEMICAEVRALSRAVPQDGNELTSLENLRR